MNLSALSTWAGNLSCLFLMTKKIFKELLGQSAGRFYPTTVSDGFVSSIKNCVDSTTIAKSTYTINCGSLVSVKVERVRVSKFSVVDLNFFHCCSICFLYYWANFQLEWKLVDT